MPDHYSQIKKNSQRRIALDPWSIGATVIAFVVLMPIGAILWFAFHPTDNIWPHLLSTTLPRYLANTGILMVCVGMLAAAIGAGAAWLVVMYQFPARR